jgi:hypothetical protein
MLARLRLLLAMSLLCLGTWFAALALEGYWPADATISTPSRPPSPGLPSKSPQTAGTAKPAAVEKRRAMSTAQSPWPLNLFGN